MKKNKEERTPSEEQRRSSLKQLTAWVTPSFHRKYHASVRREQKKDPSATVSSVLGRDAAEGLQKRKAK